MAIRKLGLNLHSLCGLAAILLWSATVAVARSLSEQVKPITAAASVYMTGGVLCAVYLLWRGHPVRRARQLPRRYLLWCGLLFTFYTFAVFFAIGLADGHQQVLELGLVNYLWPALTILFSLLLLGKRASLWLAPATLFALAGIALVLTSGGTTSWATISKGVGNNPAAYVLALLAAVSWALYSTLTRRWAGESSGGVPFFIIVTGLVLLALCLLFPEDGSWTARAAAEAVGLGVATALAYVCWDIAMRKGDVVLVGACAYLTPFLSTLISWAYLGIQPGPVLWLGCSLIVAGSFLSWMSVSAPRGGRV
jgi:drug/metabolite transporter (DMT)-like permease